MQLGIGKATITPPIGTPLAGFGDRDHGAEGVLDDLEVRALWFEQEESPRQAVCIIAADVIGFDETLADHLCQVIARNHPIDPDHVMLSASHTHSGPQTCANMLGVGAMEPGVVEMVSERIQSAVLEARHSIGPVTLQAGRGRCEGYAVNRRFIRDGKALFAPNPSGVHDDEVIAVTFRNAANDAANGEIRAILFNFTCHPTTMGDYRITSEYPGMARRHIERQVGRGAIAAFLPGCFGDIRPNCTYIGGRSFRRGQPEDVEAFGTALGDAVIGILGSGQMTALKPNLRANKVLVELPVSHAPSTAELQHMVSAGSQTQQEWAARQLATDVYNTPKITLQRVDLAEELTLIALGGEVCCDYGLYIKQLEPSHFLIPLGYTNGLTAYIPSRRMFAEGGYEVDESTLYYGLPAPFNSDIEQRIQAGIQQLLHS